MSIAQNVKKIRNSIPNNVILVAAVKYATNEQIQELIKAGIRDLGFNTYRQLESIRGELPSYARIHFIGHLQRNKVRKLLQSGIYLIQSVDSYTLTERINKIGSELEINQDILLEVKTDVGNKNKYGFVPSELEDVALKMEKDLPNLHIRGLMTVPPETENPDGSRQYFALMKRYYDELSQRLGRKLDYLSMGMSNDYKVAIGEGANMVRIGRALFQ